MYIYEFGTAEEGSRPGTFSRFWVGMKNYSAVAFANKFFVNPREGDRAEAGEDDEQATVYMRRYGKDFVIPVRRHLCWVVQEIKDGTVE